MNMYVWYLTHFDNGLCCVHASSEEDALEVLRLQCNRKDKDCQYALAFDVIQGRYDFEIGLTSDPNSKYYIHDRRWENKYHELRQLLLEEFLEVSKVPTKFYLEPYLVTKEEAFVCIGNDG